MSEATVGKWGKNLAIRVPLKVAKALGLRMGERVQVESLDGDLVIRRPGKHNQADAEAAAAEILAERERFSLGKHTIRELLEDGRRS